MFNPIVVIPTFNHHKELSSMIQKITSNGIDILIVDDGSDESTAKILRALGESTPAQLLTLENNGGKGAAVKAGILYAQSKGYSHCIQVDADGQHDINDLPQILNLARKYPQRLILGRPIFDLKTAPKGRMWGRKITNFWIAVETFSLDIKDGLCGYRCYPVEQTAQLISKVKTGNRMEFDPEILIRMRWQGVQVKSFDTRVEYGHKEPSNFNMVRDNVKISWLFMRLFFVGIARLIWRKHDHRNSSEKWSEIRERGNKFGIYITYFSYKFLKKRLTQFVLSPVLIYFFLTDKKGRSASCQYLNKIYKTRTPKLLFKPGLFASFIHYNSFASSLLDKIGIRIQGNRDDFKVSFFGYDEVEKLIKDKVGALFIGAHFGNFDVIRLLAKESTMDLKVLMYRKHAQMINGLFSNINSEKDDEIIEIESINAATAGMLADYVDQGGFLGILADRVSPGAEQRIVKHPFLGQEAKFPQGPWIIAGILKCPVIFFYAVSTGKQEYEIHFEKLFETVDISSGNRENDIKKYLEVYTNRLENACRLFPYQWYNFYNFWQE